MKKILCVGLIISSAIYAMQEQKDFPVPSFATNHMNLLLKPGTFDDTIGLHQARVQLYLLLFKQLNDHIKLAWENQEHQLLGKLVQERDDLSFEFSIAQNEFENFLDLIGHMEDEGYIDSEEE